MKIIISFMIVSMIKMNYRSLHFIQDKLFDEIFRIYYRSRNIRIIDTMH